ncbi:glutamate--cysteine ligase [Candidatus Profftia sp. (ex Adelges kitamiensis)]|uniref:glutamate--cysteine ligase n=1 Tax=Candidatus Profftia sp. (ex Adelges kitamiensis) TaxID=2864218 RepID=UPI001CE29822|nr:glutamate--cysteine ligase [Candidatus Profftia sp. (ex Adelges kitamiensis)]
MIPDASQGLFWLELHPDVIKIIRRGIERETLRVTLQGQLSSSKHPESLGKSLTHPWITTDFAESLMEFITPVYNNIDCMLSFLTDIHCYVAHRLESERMWPMSMPCSIKEEDNIILAQYGSSNIGQFKTLYRKGLKNRYGALMQMISGVHYNFSLSLEFWQEWAGVEDIKSGKEQITAGYFGLIRNYYRLGWIIPYLFGSSPAVCSSFFNCHKTRIPFKVNRHTAYLPYATSLRLSDLGYTNKSKNYLDITWNNLTDYVNYLTHAMNTPSTEFTRIGVKVGGHYRQINNNILQIENELYTFIRPKCITKNNESQCTALLRGGVEYIEVRSLDINPFAAIGINSNQSRFLDLFLIWCLLADSPKMSSDELLFTNNTWNRIILEGRKPNQKISITRYNKSQPLAKVGKELFTDLKVIATILDCINDNDQYKQVCNILIEVFDDVSLTYSAQILKEIMKKGILEYSLELSERYFKELYSHSLSITRIIQMNKKVEESIKRQFQIEIDDKTLGAIDFEEYLHLHMGVKI